MRYLVETALLTHGLRSVTNEEIKKVWKSKGKNLVWIVKGEIVIGDIDEYLAFRWSTRIESVLRINSKDLEQALESGATGALTASGTMAVCQKLGISFAVTCGIGGIGAMHGGKPSPDLLALAELPVTLVTTGPKDMLERQETIKWLQEHKIPVFGVKREYCTGYIFVGEKIFLDGIFKKNQKLPALIINEISEKERIQDWSILEAAIVEGEKAEKEGKHYHPAVNGRLDELTEGYSSQIQLNSLWENALYAGNYEKYNGFCRKDDL